MSRDLRPRRDHTDGAGFTLLEVVVALAIAALSLVTLFQTGSGGLFAADTAARIDEAIERAQSHLAAFGRVGAGEPSQSILESYRTSGNKRALAWCCTKSR